MRSGAAGSLAAAGRTPDPVTLTKDDPIGARNAGHVVGRLAADPKVFDNPGQSTKVLLTVMADRSYRNSTTGEREADAVPLEAWVRAEAQSLGVYALLSRGDLVAVDYVVRSSSYADKHTGEVIYRNALVVTDVSMLECRARAEARRRERSGEGAVVELPKKLTDAMGADAAKLPVLAMTFTSRDVVDPEYCGIETKVEYADGGFAKVSAAKPEGHDPVTNSTIKAVPGGEPAVGSRLTHGKSLPMSQLTTKDNLVDTFVSADGQQLVTVAECS